MQNGTMIGPYRIDGVLGSGGMAEVYKGWHTGLHRHEALKVPLVQASGLDATFVPRFLKEARVAASLYHPHIATIYSVSDENAPQPYFSMEWIEGLNLDELLVHSGRLALNETLAILEQVAGALDHAHEKGVVHRDIKPGNILLQRSTTPGTLWNAKVVDFGIARASEDATGKRLTKTGMIVGTPDYMSPEQAGSGPPVDHRTDIYSLGVVAYEMLCGHTPFSADPGASALAILWKHVHEPPPSLLDVVPNLPPAVNDAILWAMAKIPDDRPSTCAAWIAAMRPAPATTIAPSPFLSVPSLPDLASNTAVDPSASSAPGPLTRVAASPAAITQPEAGQPYETQVQPLPAHTSQPMPPGSPSMLPQAMPQATLPPVPLVKSNTLVENAGAAQSTIVASGTPFSSATLPASPSNQTFADVPALNPVASPAGSPIGQPANPSLAGTGPTFMPAPGVSAIGAPGGTPWPTTRGRTDGTGTGGSDKAKTHIAMAVGGALLLAGFVALRSAQTPYPSATNTTNAAGQSGTVMPTTAPSASPSATTPSGTVAPVFGTSQSGAGGLPPAGLSTGEQPQKDAGKQAQAEIEAQQARTLINDVVSTLMRVRKLQTSNMLTQSEAQTQVQKINTELRQAYKFSRHALMLDGGNVTAHVQTVRALYYLGQYGPAQSACNSALELFASNADLLDLRRKIQAKLQKS